MARVWGSRSQSLLWVVAGLAASLSARAEDIYSELRTAHADWTLFAGADYTDNATLSASPHSDTIASAGFDVSVFRDTGRFKADVDAAAEYEYYLSGSYSGQPLGHLRAVTSYALVPEQLTWALSDTYGQLNANALQPATPPNRINANVVSTGPDLNLRLGETMALQAGVHYERSNFQSNAGGQPDDQRLSANLGLVHHLSPATALSLNADASKVEYQAAGYSSYDLQELYARYEGHDPRTGLSLDAGVTEIRQSGEVARDPLLRLTLFRRLTPSWTINLSASSVFQNTSSAFASALGGIQLINGQPVPIPPTTSGPGTANGGVVDVLPNNSPFRADSARIAFDFVRPRTSFDVNGSVEHDRYLFGASGLDRDLAGAGASFDRRLRQSLSLRLSASYLRRTPSALLPADRTTYGDVALNWRAGSMLTVTGAYHREQRTTDAGGYPYLENVIYVRLAYGPPKRSPFAPSQGSGTSGTSSPSP